MDVKHHINEVQFKRLCHWADQLCGFYAGAAFLVGSAVTRADYRDVDVVIVVEDKDFEMRFGNKYELWEGRVYPNPITEAGWRYYKERIKRTRDGYYSTKLPLDVKIQCETEFLGYVNQPHLRIDSSPFFPGLAEKIKIYAAPAAVDERPEAITEPENVHRY